MLNAINDVLQGMSPEEINAYVEQHGAQLG